MLRPDGRGPLEGGALAYRIPGFPQLRVEPVYDDPEIVVEGIYPVAHLVGWVVRDTRFVYGLDRQRRDHVYFADRLAGIRDWVRAGGPERATS